MSGLIPEQRRAAERGPGVHRRGAERRPSEQPRARRRWSPLLAAGTVVLGTACVGAGVATTDLPPDGSELSMSETTEMTAPAEPAPDLEGPATPTPPASEPLPAEPNGSVPVAPALVRVRYELDGAPYAGMISFTSGEASPVTQVTRVRLPWRKEFDAAGGFVPSVSVQGAGPGSISCRITVNDELVSEVTVEGVDAVATCTAQALVETR